MPDPSLVELDLHMHGGPSAGAYRWIGMWPASTVSIFVNGRYETYERVGDPGSLNYRHIALCRGALIEIRAVSHA